MTTIQEFPREWYDWIVDQTFAIRSLTQVAMRPWGGGRGVSGSYSQLILSEIKFRPLRDPDLQDVDGFFSRAKGQSGAIRIGNSQRLAPWSDRSPSGEWPPKVVRTTSVFSDGSTFTDGSGFADGYLPPEVFVDTAAVRGATFLILGGFPASTAAVLRRNDPIEIMPNGIRASFPHYYHVESGGASDADGRIGVQIWPPLRQGVAVGDTAALRYASSVFRKSSDDQFEPKYSGAGIGSVSGSLVEALDLVP